MKRHVLIVDDEAEIRKALVAYFRTRGYDVDAAEDGTAALDVLAVKRTDVLISDIVMPRMDGVELLRQVRQQYPMTRVIMITGHVTLENALACMRHGADTCVFKPFEELGELREAVERSVASLERWESKLKELVSTKSDHLEGGHGER